MIDLGSGGKYRQSNMLSRQFEAKAAAFEGVTPEEVIITYGSLGSMMILYSTFSIKFLLEKGRKIRVLLDYPNYYYLLYLLDSFEVDVIRVMRDENMEFPQDTFILQLENSKPDIVVLTTPNNPTGKPITDDQLRDVIKACSTNTLIVIDRTCINTLPQISIRELLTEFPNRKIIAFHSFSKTKNLSGSRLGYIVTNNLEVAKEIRKRTEPHHNISNIKLGTKLFEDTKMEEQNKLKVEIATSTMKNAFKNNKYIKCYNSYSNFMLCELHGISGQDLAKYMFDNGVIIVDGEHIGLEDKYLRIQMCSSLSAIKRFIKLFNSYLRKV